MYSPRDAQQVILQKLLDRYERSTSYGQPAPWRRDVILPITAKEFPDAFAPTGRVAMESLVLASQTLAAAKAVRLRQDKAFPNERPREIRLGPAEVPQAYTLAQQAGYVPFGVVSDALRAAASALNASDLPGWMRDYLGAVQGVQGQTTAKSVGISQDRLKSEMADVLAALTAIVGLSRGFSGWERVVSERIFGDSKRLGGIRRLVTDLLRRADPAWRDVTPEDPQEILESYGVRRKPGLLRCAGAVPLTINGMPYALEAFTPTAHLPDAWADAWVRGVVEAAPAVITTIENEFPFLSYVLEAGGPASLGARGELVVFIGGFPPVALRESLKAIAAQVSHIRFQHWGDADLGGLRIWWFLRGILNRPLELYRTNADWLYAAAQTRGQALSPEERRGLERLARELPGSPTEGDTDVRAAHALIVALLTTGRKIEQERY
jgi:hypothetical protein